MKDPCKGCGFLNEYGYCECSGSDKWYACPIESKKPENVKMLEEYAEWYENHYPDYDPKDYADEEGEDE